MVNKILTVTLFLIVIAPTVCFAEKGQGNASIQLTLPSEFYAVPGVEMSIYFDNIVLTQTPQDYQYDVKCDIGEVKGQRWALVPTAQDVGKHTFSITVSDADGQPVANGKTMLQVVPAEAGNSRDIRLLFVGDSLTHATVYPNEIFRLFSQPENPQVRFLGTHKPNQSLPGVAHEGYGGWTWQYFVSHYVPICERSSENISSPFVYLAEDGEPKLDLPRYFEQENNHQLPDFVIIMLGINDCFGAPPDDPKAIDATIDAMFRQAEILLNAFRTAAPHAELGICLTTPPNSREKAFQNNYGDSYHRWGWKRIQHRLVQRQLDEFSGKNNQFIIPTELNLDPIEGYPVNNAVHPNTTGYKQIGASIYACLKARLAAE